MLICDTKFARGEVAMTYVPNERRYDSESGSHENGNW
jgi:hypothetical protein